VIAADWLNPNVDRPPLPRRVKAEPYVGRHRAAGWDDDVDFVPSPVPRGCAPAWPEVDDDVPTVEFRAVKPRRFSRAWWLENLSWQRVTFGGASAVAFLLTGLEWIR
jgi:hypothetical protein